MDKEITKAWAFKTINKRELRYKGNNGYDDNPTKRYTYDNLVANHKRVSDGDLVVIYNRKEIIGAARIESILKKDTLKEINKCPTPGCNADKLRTRDKKTPKWRCSNGHEFEKADKESIPVTQYTVNFSKSFVKIKKPYLLLEGKILNHNKQLSIQEVKLEWAKNLLNGVDDHLEELSPDESMEAPAIFSKEDYRDIVNRSIKQRRGQKSFRENLIKSHPKCAVTRSEIIDILEAAHIFPYRNSSHNHISNGLLLRADIHTLFDLNLIAINPNDLTVEISKILEKTEYKNFERVKLELNHSISIEALLERWELFSCS
ncbi:HNH endonuclease [Pantoea sp. At-9b]|uniref:HNH endonuclease n=1 Tax=Pantoea sp. (strain At-9b) TaxID=592316 RepID=UPI0001B3F21E|nr:HNH endonuclease [Pantoea sp. At-9b]ADU70729.1 conserved hypothetical protein [Pantoea sp. At-9b]